MMGIWLNLSLLSEIGGSMQAFCCPRTHCLIISIIVSVVVVIIFVSPGGLRSCKYRVQRSFLPLLC